MLASVLALTVALGAEPEPAPAPPPTDAVVLIVQGGATCAGAFIDDRGTIATAYHCVVQGGRPRVETRDGRTAIARVEAVNARWDLAILSAPGLADQPHLTVRRDVPAPGEGIRALGHPFGTSAPGGFLTGTLRWSVSQGIVSAVGPRAIQTTAPVNPGNSGGPIIDDEGRLVGVVSRRLKGDGLGFAGRSDAIQQMLDRPTPMGLGGGTIGLEVWGAAWEGSDGTLSAGVAAELALRDRVVVSVGGGHAFDARWDAMRFGSVTWLAGEGRAGLRQRLFRGYWTTRIDAYGGVGLLRTYERRGDDIAVVSSERWAPLVGGGLTVAAGGLSAAFSPTEGPWDWRLMLTFKWPGVLWVF